LKALISLSALPEDFSIEPHRILPDVMMCMLIFNCPSCSVEEKKQFDEGVSAEKHRPMICSIRVSSDIYHATEKLCPFVHRKISEKKHI